MLTDQQRDEMLASRPAPTVTRDSITARIANVEYLRPVQESTLNICVVTMANGFTIVGKSACASPENYVQELGQKIAYDDCFNQAWALEGYLLRELLKHEDDAAKAA